MGDKNDMEGGKMQLGELETWGPAREPQYLSEMPAPPRGVAVNSTETTLLPLAVLESAITSALDAIPGPAFVFGEDGLVRRANQASMAVFVNDTRELLEAVADDPTQTMREVALRWRVGSYVVTRLSRVIAPCIYLAVGRAVESDLPARLDALSERWKLSGRQREALELLVQGLPNKAIAERLGIAVGTVEIHVSKVLRQAGCESRAALAAKFFSEPLT